MQTPQTNQKIKQFTPKTIFFNFCENWAVTGPVLEMSCERKLLLVPYERPHVMDGVVGILLTARRLLDAGELFYMSEHMRAVPNSFLLEGDSRFGVARESLIE